MPRVVELFAGVGGFRLGLEGRDGNSASSNYEAPMPEGMQGFYEFVWANQWEPGSKKQEAFKVYKSRFDGEHSNEDIAYVIENKFNEIPNHDLLVGGFPCQDYSVAKTLSKAAGIVGVKGVLWWSIHDILRRKKAARRPVRFLMLENVDRLLKSPVGQRGRDFAIMLSSLADLGYAVEWRVINAAEYGMPQKRRRVFLMAYYMNTPTYRTIRRLREKLDWIYTDGLISRVFPVQQLLNNNSKVSKQTLTLDKDLISITKSFNLGGGKSPFENAGVMINREVWTAKTFPSFKGEPITLGDIIFPNDDEVPEKYFIKETDYPAWVSEKGAKRKTRVSDEGFEYNYAEGAMSFPDPLDRPARTIITGEGGASASRFKHVIASPQSGRLRRLMPEELEKINMFPVGHTEGEGVTDIRRAFFMGNALVVGVIEKLGTALFEEIQENGMEI